MSTERRDKTSCAGAEGVVSWWSRWRIASSWQPRPWPGPTFVSPSLSGLIAEANRGVNTGPAVINTMLSALQTQLTSGPLADLNAAPTGDGFVTESQDLVSSYSQSVDQQLLPRFPHIDQILQLQGQRIVADLVSLNQQETVGIITSTSNLSIAAGGAIAALTDGPILPLETPISAYITTTQSFETNLGKLVATLNSSSPSDTQPGEHHASGRGRSLSHRHERRSPGDPSQHRRHGRHGRDDPRGHGQHDRSRNSATALVRSAHRHRPVRYGHPRHDGPLWHARPGHPGKCIDRVHSPQLDQ